MALKAGGDLRRRLGVVVSVALLGVACALAVFGGDGDGEEQLAALPPRIVGPEDLTELEETLGHQLYWAGPRAPAKLEVSTESDGSAFLRYLPPGVEPGDARAAFLTVGTYPVGDAQVSLKQAAQESGGTLGQVEDGGLTLENPASKGSVYLAYPSSDLQIEVYDPRPGRALELIRSGMVKPVGD